MTESTPTKSGGQGRPEIPYFIGKPNHLGQVTRSEAIDFKAFTMLHLNLASSVGITRFEYQELPEAERRTAKRVSFFVPCWYERSPSDRKSPNPRGISLICIDIDSAEGARPYRSCPDSLLSQLGDFNFALYETASSTADHPRVRLVVDADLPLECYKEAVRDVAARIGLEPQYLNSESLIANQPMFFPTIWKGDSEEQHPLLIFHLDGKRYGYRDLPSGEKKSDSPPTFISIDALDYLSSRTEGLILEDAKETLEYLDPDMPYGSWLSVAAALRHQFIENSDEAYELFDSWSKRGTKYKSESDTKAKWNSLKANTTGRNPVTMRSVFHMAKQNGWIGLPTTARVNESVFAWIMGGCDNSRDPLAEGIQRIASVPQLTPVEQEVLLKNLASVISRRMNTKISYLAVKQQLKEFQKRISLQMQKAQAAKQQWPKWALGLCFLENRDRFYRASTGNTLSPAALDRSYTRHLASSDSSMVAPDEKGVSIPKPQDYLLNVVKCPTAHDTMYDPSRPEQMAISYKGTSYINSYIRSYPEPNAEKAPYAEKIFRAHMATLIAEPWLREIVISFLAYLVQEPGGKIRWAILLQGAEGCGKSFLTEAAKAVLGDAHVAPVDFPTIKGAWNDWATDCQLVTIEEIRVSGANRREMMDRIKPNITNTYINISRRFRDSYQCPNFTNYLMFSNHMDALLLDRSDRRYCVIWSPIQRKEQVLALGDEYFEILFDMLKSHKSGLRHWLENYPICKEFNPNGHAPWTRYRDLMVEDSEGELVPALKDIMDSDTNPYICSKVMTSRGVAMVAEMIGRHASHPTQLSQAVKSLGFTSTERVTLDDHERHRLYVPFVTDLTTQGAAAIINERIRLHESGILAMEDSLL